MKIIISIFMLILSIYGYADSIAPPKPYILDSTDSKLRFVSLVWTSVQTEDGKVYSQSGLYHIDNDNEPIWSISIDRYASGGVYLSRDGAYLVNTGPWASELSDVAVAFYHNGKLLKEYKISDLLTDKSAIVRTVSHFFWEKKTGFDDIHNTYLIKTLAGDTYLFDITTGGVIGKSHKTLPTVNALIRRSDGKKIQASNLKLCPNVLDIMTEVKYDEMESGIIGFLESEYDKKDEDSTVLNMINIPFKHIYEIARTNNTNEFPAKFRLSLQDGEAINLVTENIYFFCAFDEENNYTKIRIIDVRRITNVEIANNLPDQSDNNPEFAQALKQFNESHSWLKASIEPSSKSNTASKTVAIPDSQFTPIPSGRECEEKLAGLGRRAKAICYDLVNTIWRGPLMVVIPAGVGDAQKPFAISKFEISIGDYSKYCMITGKCNPSKDKEMLNEPQTGISLIEANEYTQWLSKRTGKNYRLPTPAEWEYAANANGDQPRKDFNCRVILSGKVMEGKSIASVNSGLQNGWGLKNYIGNVQEWVIEGDTVIARGGAYTDPMSNCDISFSRPHSGNADDVTGFRVLLEME